MRHNETEEFILSQWNHGGKGAGGADHDTVQLSSETFWLKIKELLYKSTAHPFIASQVFTAFDLGV